LTSVLYSDSPNDNVTEVFGLRSKAINTYQSNAGPCRAIIKTNTMKVPAK